MSEDIYTIEIRIMRTRVQFEIYSAAFAAAEKVVIGLRDLTDPKVEDSMTRLSTAESDLETIRQMYRDSLRKLERLEFDYRIALREKEATDGK